MVAATKECPKCGWVYPITYPEVSCRFCGTRFKKGFCDGCGKYDDIRYGRLCTKCYSRKIMDNTTTAQATAKWQRRYARRRQEKEDVFDEWLAAIARVPKPLQTLTQAEWVAACKHFGHCALCGQDSIDARGMFVAYALGGRYAAWNIIPICDKCATALKHIQNPFIKYSDAAPAIAEYLRPILERVIESEKNI